MCNFQLFSWDVYISLRDRLCQDSETSVKNFVLEERGYVVRGGICLRVIISGEYVDRGLCPFFPGSYSRQAD